MRALAHHPAGEDEREGHQRANLKLGLVLLHPREARVLEDLRPLLLRGLEAQVLRDLAHAPLVVRLHLREVQEEHVGLVAERPPAVDEAEEEHCQQPTRRHDLRRHVWEAGQHTLVEEGLERRLQELLAHLRLAPVLERLWIVRLDERLERDDRLLRVAHHHDVLQVLTVVGEAAHLGQRRALGPGLRVRLEGAWHVGGHLLPALEELLVGLVRTFLKLGPRHLGIDVLKVRVAARLQLVKNVHGPSCAALARHGDDRVALSVLDLRLERRLEPVHHG
mmetsp:Transcript_39615/g.95285  ORF Transcript_39615/g.95285 Transcript_39615/m.95285 type:complete len:278 (+) Transcript_39615:3604-4437(+)